MKRTAKSKFNETGQTLIETVVAIFVLVMGITAAVGLAVFALNSSTNVGNQIVALGLAREGIEAVKNMRDTNWLQQTSINNDCHNFASDPVGLLNAPCYKNWQRQQYCLNPTNNNGSSAACTGNLNGPQNYFLRINANQNAYWDLNRQYTTSNFGMNFDPSLTNHNGYYLPSGNPNGIENPAGFAFYRQLIIQEIFTSPYDTASIGPKLRVTSRVWWRGKKCPSSTSYAGARVSCKLELVTFLTNWKNY